MKEDVSKKNSSKRYNPNLGFIGNIEVKVANYLFSAKKARKAYTHAQPVAKRILEKEVEEHFHESKKLTKFLKAIRHLLFPAPPQWCLYRNHYLMKLNRPPKD